MPEILIGWAEANYNRKMGMIISSIFTVKFYIGPFMVNSTFQCLYIDACVMMNYGYVCSFFSQFYNSHLLGFSSLCFGSHLLVSLKLILQFLKLLAPYLCIPSCSIFYYVTHDPESSPIKCFWFCFICHWCLSY